MAAIDAGTIYSSVRVALDKLKGDISKVETELDKFGKTNQQRAQKTATSWKDGFKKINLAGVAAFAGIAIAVKESIKTFATFEQSLANVRSVAQATDEEFEKIEKAALEAGETTRFKATQAADAMYYLASAGFDATQSVEALNGVLLLAGSTGSDLAKTSETVASAISQFNLEAKDAERVANVFAAAITNSQATMDKLAVSLRYVGPVASSMNKTIEETAGLLQILYNNGFEASQAGTALRSSLADLSNAASPAVKRLKELGVSFDEVNPQTNTFADIIDVLNEKVTDGSDIMQIFGNRAGPAMIKLIQAGREEVEKYTEAVTGTNAAAEAYAIQNDTLQGSIDLLLSAVESAQIKFTKELAPAIRGAVEIFTGLVKIIADIPTPLKVLFGVLAIGTPIVLGVITAVQAMSTAFTVSTGIIGAVVTGIALLAAGIVALQGHMDKAGGLRDATDNLTESVEELKQANEELKDETKELNEEEERTLKNRIALTQERVKGAVAGEVSALKDAIVSRRAYNEAIEKNLDLQKQVSRGVFLEGTMQLFEYTKEVSKLEGGVKALSDAGIRLRNGWETELQYQGALGTAYGVAIDKRDELTSTIDKSIDTLARYLKEGYIEVEQLTSLDPFIARMIIRRSQEIEVTKDSTEATKEDNEVKIENRRRTEELKDATEELNETTEKYKQKIEDLRASAQEAIELERQRAIEAIKSTETRTKAEEDAKQAAIDAVNEYYDALIDKTAQEEFEKNNKKMWKSIEDGFFNLSGNITGLFSAIADARLRQIDAQLKAELEAAGVAEKSAVESAETELAAARKAGDEELIIEKEKALTKARIEEEYARKKAQIQYESQMAIWQITLAQTLAEAARGIAVAVAGAPWPFNLPAIAFATITGGLQTATVAANQPPKPAFQYGGIVVGPSGIDNIEAKLSSGEMVLTPEQQRTLFDLANGRGIATGRGDVPIHVTVQTYLDIVKIADEITKVQNNGVVRIKS